MSYLAKLNQFDEENFSHQSSDIELSKPPKPPFIIFDGADQDSNSKKSSCIESKLSSHKTNDALRKLKNLDDRQYEAGRQKAIALMNESPVVPRGIYVDEELDPDNVVIFFSSRFHQQTCHMLIPKEKYVPWKLLRLIEQLSARKLH